MRNWWQCLHGLLVTMSEARWHQIEKGAVCLGSIAFTIALLINAVACSPTVDEPGHLAAGVSYWRLGQFHLYRVNPPLIKLIAAIPALAEGGPSNIVAVYAQLERKPTIRRNISLGYDFFDENRNAAHKWLIYGRLCCLPFCLVGAWTCWRWADELYGRPAGLVALLLWITSPLILGHGCLITSDVAGSALGVLAAYLFWRWLRADTLHRLLLAGTSLGLAISAKSTWVIGLILWPLFLADNFRLATKRAQIVRMAILLGIAVYVVNCLYGFEGTFTSLGHIDFVSRQLRGTENLGAAGNMFRETWLAGLPIPFPKNFISGIDLQLADFERSWPCYLAGEWKQHGWWYFYLIGLFVKHPVGLGVMTLICVVQRVCKRDNTASADRMPCVLAIAFLVLVSAHTSWTQHVRYAMPVLPFWYVWVSQIVSRSCRPWQSLLLVVGLFGYVLESAAAFPHSLAFFNVAVGGSRCGPSLLVDSNQDWGQDLGRLKLWMDAHSEVKSMHLAYFGGSDPSLMGLHFDTLSCAPKPGWYAVSTTFLQGGSFHAFDGTGRTYWLQGRSLSCFKDLVPVARIGQTIFVYHLSDQPISNP